MKFLKRFILEIKGFTLVELVIVIAIIGIIVSITVIPKSTISNYELKSNAKELTSDIRQIRYLKTTKGHSYSLFIGSDYYSVYKDKSMIKKVQLKDVTCVQDFKGSIVFSYNGSPKVGGTVRLIDNNTNKSYRITIVPFTGRVLLQSETDI